jgi:hypothetical protein
MGTAGVIAAIVLGWPLLRLGGIVPVDQLLDYIAHFKPDRAASLAYRFLQEESLLEKVRDRAFTGWGGFGRILVYDEVTGRNLTVVDGTWIVQLGYGGFVRFGALFGLLGWPILRALRAAPRMPDCSSRRLVRGLAVLTALLLLDLIPNSGPAQLQFWVAGMLLGVVKERGTAMRISPSGVAARLPFGSR